MNKSIIKLRLRLKLQLRTIVSLILVSAFIAGSIPEAVSAAVPSVQAKAYVVMDANSGEVLYNKNMNKTIYPASTVKLMTAIVALDNAALNQKIKFTKKMKRWVPSDASNLGLKTGTTYNVNQYLHMMLIASDADSAVALAYGAGGSYNQFINLMNTKAQSYGMEDTSFDNPMGLDKGNGYKETYTSAYDFAILARHAMSYSAIRNIVAKSKYKVPARKGKPSFTIKNTNQFYSTYKLKDKTYEIIGSKTGTTTAAGRVLIVTAKDKAGHELICAYFGGDSSAALYGGIEKLLDYAFEQNSGGKIKLALGFWDTRYRKSESAVCKYASLGILPMTANGKFNPERIKPAAFTLDMVNKISGLTMAADENDSLTVANLAIAYYNTSMAAPDGVGAATSAAITNDTPQDTLTDYELSIVNTLEGIESFGISEQKKIAYLYSSKAMESTGITDVNHELSKEEAVLIADSFAI